MPVISQETIDQLKTQSKEPAVVEAILGAINKQNASAKTIKDNISEVQKDFEEYKKKNESKDGVDKHTVAKLEEAVVTRQEAIDSIESKITALNTRLDAIEVYNQRTDGSYQIDDVIAPGETLKEQTNYFRAMVGSELLDYKTDARKTNRPLLATDLPNITPNQYLEYRKLLWQYLSGTISADQATDRRQRFFDNLTVVYPPAAGWLVLPVIATRIRQKEREMDPLLNYVNTLNVSTGDRYLEYVSFTNPEARMRESEFDSGVADPVIDYDKFEVPFNEIYKQVTLTRQAMDDIPMAERLLGDKAGVAIAYTEARQVVNGDGIIEPRGILSYPDGTAYGEIPRVTVTASNAFTYDTIIDFMFSLESYALNRADLRLFANRLVIAALMKIKDDYGRPLWQPSLIQGQPATFHGRAIEMSPNIPSTIGTDGSELLILAALGEAYTFINRTNVRVFRNPYVAFPQTIIDVSKRIGGGVVMPNYVVIGISD